MAGAGGLPIDSAGDWQEVTHSHQVVGSGGGGPTNPGDSTMTSLAQSGDCLEPAEDLFHSFTPPLAEQVARVVPLGYEVRDRQLVMTKTEATTVRDIFTRYCELGSVRLLKEELDRNGVRSRIRVSKDGSSRLDASPEAAAGSMP